MAASGILPALLLFLGIFVSIKAQCTKEDIRLKFSACSDTASKIILSQHCTGFGPEIMSVFQCYKGCKEEEIPSSYASNLLILTQSLDKAMTSRCNFTRQNGPAEARDGPVSACGLQEGISCITTATGLGDIPKHVQMGNLEGICNIIKGFGGVIDGCGGLILDCLDTFAALGVNLAEIRTWFKRANELSKGGCNCASQIENSVQAYTALPRERNAGNLVCPIIVATTRTVKGVMDSCVSDIIKAVQETSFNWLDITLSAINIANPVIEGICGTVSILAGNGAPTIGLGFLTAASVVLVHLLRQIDIM